MSTIRNHPDAIPMPSATPSSDFFESKKMDNYSINCTGDVVVGDEIEFSESVFGKGYFGKFSKSPKFLGKRIIRAKVVKDSYGKSKQQHTFTLVVLESKGYSPLLAGSKILRKGRNVYRDGTKRKPWDCEEERKKVADEKHSRGDIARAKRSERRTLESLKGLLYHSSNDGRGE